MSAYLRTSYFSMKTVWWQATKLALLMRHVCLMGLGPNLRWLTVRAPAFFES